MVAVRAVWGEPSQLDMASRDLRYFFLWSESYGRLSRMASGNTHVAAMFSDVGAVLSSTLLPQMAVHPLWATLVRLRSSCTADGCATTYLDM